MISNQSINSFSNDETQTPVSIKCDGFPFSESNYQNESNSKSYSKFSQRKMNHINTSSNKTLLELRKQQQHLQKRPQENTIVKGQNLFKHSNEYLQYKEQLTTNIDLLKEQRIYKIQQHELNFTNNFTGIVRVKRLYCNLKYVDYEVQVIGYKIPLTACLNFCSYRRKDNKFIEETQQDKSELQSSQKIKQPFEDHIFIGTFEHLYDREEDIIKIALSKLLGFLQIAPPLIKFQNNVDFLVYKENIVFQYQQCDYLSFKKKNLPQKQQQKKKFKKDLKFILFTLHSLKLGHQKINPNNMMYSRNLKKYVLYSCKNVIILKQTYFQSTQILQLLESQGFNLQKIMSKIKENKNMLQDNNSQDLYYKDIQQTILTIQSIQKQKYYQYIKKSIKYKYPVDIKQKQNKQSQQIEYSLKSKQLFDFFQQLKYLEFICRYEYLLKKKLSHHLMQKPENVEQQNPKRTFCFFEKLYLHQYVERGLEKIIYKLQYWQQKLNQLSNLQYCSSVFMPYSLFEQGTYYLFLYLNQLNLQNKIDINSLRFYKYFLFSSAISQKSSYLIQLMQENLDILKQHFQQQNQKYFLLPYCRMFQYILSDITVKTSKDLSFIKNENIKQNIIQVLTGINTYLQGNQIKEQYIRLLQNAIIMCLYRYISIHPHEDMALHQILETSHSYIFYVKKRKFSQQETLKFIIKIIASIYCIVKRSAQPNIEYFNSMTSLVKTQLETIDNNLIDCYEYDILLWFFALLRIELPNFKEQNLNIPCLKNLKNVQIEALCLLICNKIKSNFGESNQYSLQIVLKLFVYQSNSSNKVDLIRIYIKPILTILRDLVDYVSMSKLKMNIKLFTSLQNLRLYSIQKIANKIEQIINKLLKLIDQVQCSKYLSVQQQNLVELLFNSFQQIINQIPKTNLQKIRHQSINLLDSNINKNNQKGSNNHLKINTKYKIYWHQDVFLNDNRNYLPIQYLYGQILKLALAYQMIDYHPEYFENVNKIQLPSKKYLQEHGIHQIIQNKMLKNKLQKCSVLVNKLYLNTEFIDYQLSFQRFKINVRGSHASNIQIKQIDPQYIVRDQSDSIQYYKITNNKKNCLLKILRHKDPQEIIQMVIKEIGYLKLLGCYKISPQPIKFSNGTDFVIYNNCVCYMVEQNYKIDSFQSQRNKIIQKIQNSLKQIFLTFHNAHFDFNTISRYSIVFCPSDKKYKLLAFDNSIIKVFPSYFINSKQYFYQTENPMMKIKNLVQSLQRYYPKNVKKQQSIENIEFDKYKLSVDINSPNYRDKKQQYMSLFYNQFQSSKFKFLESLDLLIIHNSQLPLNLYQQGFYTIMSQFKEYELLQSNIPTKCLKFIKYIISKNKITKKQKGNILSTIKKLFEFIKNEVEGQNLKISQFEKQHILRYCKAVELIIKIKLHKNNSQKEKTKKIRKYFKIVSKYIKWTNKQSIKTYRKKKQYSIGSIQRQFISAQNNTYEQNDDWEDFVVLGFGDQQQQKLNIMTQYYGDIMNIFTNKQLFQKHDSKRKNAYFYNNSQYYLNKTGQLFFIKYLWFLKKIGKLFTESTLQFVLKVAIVFSSKNSISNITKRWIEIARNILSNSPLLKNSYYQHVLNQFIVGPNHKVVNTIQVNSQEIIT